MSDMIWYPVRGPSCSRARIAARTSPRPAFRPRPAPGDPGGPGHQEPHGPPDPPHWPPLGPPKPPRTHGPLLPPGPAAIQKAALRRWPSISPAQLSASNRPGSKSPTDHLGAGIAAPPFRFARYDRDISTAYVEIPPMTRYDSFTRQDKTKVGHTWMGRCRWERSFWFTGHGVARTASARSEARCG